MMIINIEHPSAENHKGSDLITHNNGVVKLPDVDVVESSGRKTLEPHESMEFESKEDAFNFYKQYAISVGFSAIIKASRRSRISGKFIDAKFVCTRYGSKRGACSSENSQLKDVVATVPVKKKRGRINRSWSKTDCKACMHVNRRQDGRWIVKCFVKEHNHDHVFDQAGLKDSHNVHARVRNKKMCMSLFQPSDAVEISEHHKITGSSSSGSCLGFREGDVQVMLEYFSCMQDENPYFFYAIDLNREQKLRNVFWVNAKARIDYRNFGDAVLFDTTYKTNGFKFPFVSFIGMNNHFQFLLLGCAFLGDESKSTYTWLIRAWLRSMHGQAPKVILTDQDPVLKEVIAEVLPGSRHCFSVSHVMSKVQEKLVYVIRQHDNFVSKFYKCVSKSQTEAQFEKRWWKLVDRFELRSDKWIESLYDNRFRWVPTFMEDIFFAGLSSAQRSESVTSLLDKCLLRKTSLKEFMHQYNIILQEKYDDEAKAEFDTWHRQPGLKSPSPYEKQTATMYTNVVFKKFQVEVLGVVACHLKIESQDGATTTFNVQDFETNQVYKVTWNEKTSNTSCTCRLFEYNGFLCRHVLVVLQISGVNNIPEKYILKRWTKNAKSREAMKQVDSVEMKNHCYYDICQRAFSVVDEVSLCQEAYSAAFTILKETFRKCGCTNTSVKTQLGTNSPTNACLSVSEEVSRGASRASGNNQRGALL